MLHEKEKLLRVRKILVRLILNLESQFFNFTLRKSARDLQRNSCHGLELFGAFELQARFINDQATEEVLLIIIKASCDFPCLILGRERQECK